MQNVVILNVMAPFTITLNCHHLFQGIDRKPNYNRGISKRHSTLILGTYTQIEEVHKCKIALRVFMNTIPGIENVQNNQKVCF